MQCTVLPHITASVFINDDNAQAFARSGLHHDYEPFGKLRRGCGSKGWRLTRRSTTPVQGSVAQPHGRGLSRRNLRGQCRCAPKAGSTSRLHFGSTSRLHFAGHGTRRGAVVAVTNGRLDGFAQLAEVFGTWERNL
jgi:hypothetical protein